MSNKTVVVFTFESIDRILHDGGTSEWRLDRNRARQCAFAVCVRHSNAKPRTEGPEAHRSAFLIGKVSNVVASPGAMRRRCLIQFSEYALVNIHETWRKGDRNPVRYGTLEELGIDPSKLEWKPMPAPVGYGPRIGDGAGTDNKLPFGNIPRLLMAWMRNLINNDSGGSRGDRTRPTRSS